MKCDPASWASASPIMSPPRMRRILNTSLGLDHCVRNWRDGASKSSARLQVNISRGAILSPSSFAGPYVQGGFTGQYVDLSIRLKLYQL